MRLDMGFYNMYTRLFGSELRNEIVPRCRRREALLPWNIGREDHVVLPVDNALAFAGTFVAKLHAEAGATSDELLDDVRIDLVQLPSFYVLLLRHQLLQTPFHLLAVVGLIDVQQLDVLHEPGVVCRESLDHITGRARLDHVIASLEEIDHAWAVGLLAFYVFFLHVLDVSHESIDDLVVVTEDEVLNLYEVCAHRLGLGAARPHAQALHAIGSDEDFFVVVSTVFAAETFGLCGYPYLVC